MSKKTEQARFTKVTTDLLLDVRDLVNWGMATGNTTPELMQLTIAARRDAAVKLIESGVSQRQTAKLLGVSHQTIMRDVVHHGPQNGPKSTTRGAATMAHRATMAAKAEDGATSAPTDKYRIIYADPPWSYGNTQPDYHTEQRDHYPVTELGEICSIPVKDWIEDNAVAFIWATSPILEESFQVVHAWGFEYKSTFIWDKIKHNMAHYNSMRHEILLICTRGSCQPDVKILIDSVQTIERGKHSEKPVEFYDIIETLYIHGRKLEIFARKRRDGWDAYGHVAEISEAAE